jgi:hypothetical protein
VVLNVVMKKCHDFRIYFFAEFGWGKSGSRVGNNPPFAMRPQRMGHPVLWLKASNGCG